MLIQNMYVEIYIVKKANSNNSVVFFAKMHAIRGLTVNSNVSIINLFGTVQ